MGRAIGLIILGILAVILLTVTASSISGQTSAQIAGVQIVSAAETSPIADYIVIGGKLSDAQTGEWLNNYPIIPYMEGVEITVPQTRFLTRRGEHSASGEGVHDGFFLIKIPNHYKLTAANNFLNADGKPVQMRYIDNGMMAPSELFVWLSDVHPGQIFCLEVPDKQTDFTIVAMPQDNAHLPEKIQQNKTILLDNRSIQPVDTDTANGTVTFSFDQALNLPDPTLISELWTREFYPLQTLTIDEVFTQYVAPATSGITAEQFAEQVRKYNDLDANGLFHPNQKYFLPLADAS